MPGGIFTQTVIILLREEVAWEQLRLTLKCHTILNEHPARSNWAFGGACFILNYRPEKNGYVAVDLVGERWPDRMGDAKQEWEIFGAWMAGNFGRLTYPGGLQRAMQQCWGWDQGKELPALHNGFIRVRSSYAFGVGEYAPLWPDDYDAEQDLEFVTHVARSLLTIPQALCYFNPGGEVLRDRTLVEESLEYGKDNELPPLELWSNVRLFNIDENWSLMDTVGNEQLDVCDIEVAFDRSYDPGQMDGFLRNVTLYLLNNGDVIKDRDSMDGPGGVAWRAHHFENGLCDPPRGVICFVPMDDSETPEPVLNRPARK